MLKTPKSVARLNDGQHLGKLIHQLLEAAAAVFAWLFGLAWFGMPLEGSSLIFLLLVVSLTYPSAIPLHLEPAELVIQTVLEFLWVFLILGLLGWVTGYLDVFPAALLKAWMVTAPLLAILLHGMMPVVARWLTEWTGGRQKAVVVGAGPLGQMLADKLIALPHLSIDFIGFFDDRTPDRLGLKEDRALQHLGNSEALAEFVRRQGIDLVYITLNMGLSPRNLALLDDLRDTTASIYYAPDLFLLDLVQARMDTVDDIPVVAACESPFYGMSGFVKRLSDIVFAGLILLLIWPILLGIAIAVRRDSPGPVIFAQRRYGLDGKEITVYKFRSMRVMEDGAKVTQATRDDDRITRIGAFLRKTSLDELPQFINVLQGRMSIVGPRPHAVAHNEHYRKLVGGYMVRHKVRPGITGWAQVNGFRGETDTLDKMQARIEHDIAYLRNWSIKLDVVIILRTVLLVVHDRTAY